MQTKLIDTDIDYWLTESQYPLTVIADRYGGAYSGGKYLAWPREYYDIEKSVAGGDPECMRYWDSFDDIVGRGWTIDEAIADLRHQLQAEKDCGYKHCRKMKDILRGYGTSKER